MPTKLPRRTSERPKIVSGQSHFGLESVQLERFKAAFRPDALPVAPFTAIVGRNGSGKSTVLEALQWLDVALRFDTVRASERYGGVHDLLNIRSRASKRYFKLILKWAGTQRGARVQRATYELRINESSDGRPLVHSEKLDVLDEKNAETPIIRTEEEGSRSTPGRRLLLPLNSDRRRVFDDPDRLALSRLGGGTGDGSQSNATLEAVRSFWDRAVFLRLSPQRLALGSPPRRKSFEPLLDEEGQSLPALLNELTDNQKEALVSAMNSALPDVRKIVVSNPTTSRELNASWSIREKMPTGHAGRGTYEIPASMLSEGTRRLTAILALLIRKPAPSLLCIEEIENGLDPWTILDVLRRLQTAPRGGTQVILTTHSPWLLDSLDVDAIRLVRRTGGNTKYSTFRSEAAKQRFVATVPAGAQYVNLPNEGD